MLKYRKLPVVIEAVCFFSPSQFAGPGNGGEVADWCGGVYLVSPKPGDPVDVSYRILIPTLEGTMTANPGDWIIWGVKGEFYPCKPDIFAATYEEVPGE